MILDFINEETDTVSCADILQVFTNCNELDLFCEVSTSARIKSFLDKCGMVRPEKVEIGLSKVWTKGGKLTTRQDYAYVVPFLRNLELYLNNHDVLSCVDNPKFHDGTLRTVLDGSYYRSHEVFKRDKKALSIIVYYDDVEFANPLGSKTRKLAMFYWTLGNIYPELRSSLRSINLLAITTNANLKKHGAEKVLNDFLSSLALLGSEEGVSLKIKNVQRKFTGFLNFVAGDTPASAYLGGFKEGVAKAQRPCRTCLADKQSIQGNFSEELFVIRNIETHAQHCEDINSIGLTKQSRDFWSAFYGVNYRSPFMNLDNTDVTKIFPHDFMHVMLEGALAVEIKNFLTYCIENRRFTFQDLNASIASFDYGHLVNDKPSPIEPQHLANGLKQGAAQMLALGNFLPFLIGKWLTNDDRNNLLNYIILLQIKNLSMSFELEIEDAFLLKRMVRVYLTNFFEMYPNQNITPKQHYLVHFYRQILLFGPIRQHSCFRFEGAHAYFKQLIVKLKNYINVPYTLAFRRQALMASLLATIPGKSQKFLCLGDVVRRGKKIHLKDHDECDLLKELLQVGDDVLVMLSPSLSIYGTVYRKDSVILLQNEEDNFPNFGQITQIVVYEDQKILLYKELKTLFFDETLNAYKVQLTRPTINGALSVSNLIFPHSLSLYKYKSEFFVTLFNSRRIEFGG